MDRAVVRRRTLVAVVVLVVLGLVAAGVAGALRGDPDAETVPGVDARVDDASAGCGTPAGLTTGEHALVSGGVERTYRLDVPAGYDPDEPHRLVLAFHWWTGTSQDVVDRLFYGLQPLADGSTVFVAPQGVDDAWADADGSDVTFVDDVLREVEAALCVDPTQRFAVGFSYGGSMSHALACARADVFRAVAVLNGAEISGCEGGTEPIAYLGSHGVVDDVLPIERGRALRDRALRTNRCEPQEAPEPAPGSGEHTVTRYTCAEGYPVVWIASDSGHEWDARGTSREPTFVPGTVWDFFTSVPPAPVPAATS
ncbi:PHB depolymerase family esterase [Cellulomonas sp. B6]|uniref:alpha/beta hydrolase family esterase n=1 Tax=Cellulomonas sp. B6 TaxID=1295626 RepID=UPI00073B8A11|nr:hypothetical protein [Cellulomonas sp. B6]KSW19118.1 hypothetical protein ATM99_16920 [Cellulomonas sp. B6]